ncbi:MAG: ATP-binding cassette domain-containing protein [Bacteroidetes bacterium]|nr:ATP-binding cassette domain-containing protein [Bacteroidota bacterium]
MEILKVENVVKKFGDKIVSNNISFTINQGKIFGLLGPNGAGKTTLIRQICNIFQPDEGTITLFQQKMSPDLQNKIGYLPEERGLYKKSKIIDQITYFGELKGMAHKTALQKAYLWLDKLGARGWENKKVEELSKGMQQKIQFISTVIHTPDLLILDEPFSGFDPVNTELLKNVILEMKAQGITIILSTHVMSQVEELCDEICMINNGEAVLFGAVNKIREQYQRNIIHIEYKGNIDINNLENVNIINHSDGSITLKITNSNFNKKEFIAILNEKTDIISFAIDTPSMHEIFIDVIAKSNSNEAL